MGALLAERGHEFGSTTGRPRRCGWFDAVMLRRNASINSLTELCLTKLDVLDTLDEVWICIGYRGQNADGFGVNQLQEVDPVYVKMPGWKSDTSAIKNFDDLPEAAKAYIKALEEHVGLPISMIS